MRRIIAVLVVVLATNAFADVKTAGLFSDNMVLQRDAKVPIWGTADPGEKITVEFQGQKVTDKADKQGKWKVFLKPLKASSKGAILKISSIQNPSSSTNISNILVGDVWLCSGQSNMGMKVEKCLNAEEDIKNANDTEIRHFRVNVNPTQTVAEDVEGEWQICSPDTVGGFSATAYFTARELRKDLNVPMGLLNAAVGGTIIQAWIDEETLKDDSLVQEKLKEIKAEVAVFDQEEADRINKQRHEEWKKKADEANANNQPLPRRPKRLRDPLKSINYPSSLYRGMIYPIETFAVKGCMWYQGESNAFSPISGEHYNVFMDMLISSWREKWKQARMPFFLVQLPNFQEAQEDPGEEMGGWALIRESFSQSAMKMPDTGMAVTIDIGESDDIHPRNKQDVGKRMASTILNMVYGKETPTSPVCVATETEGDKVVVSFKYTGLGLMAKGGKLGGFAVAGADKKFVWADAVIEERDGKDVVVVSSPEVKSPASVRYGWAKNPTKCSLYSKEGFPASPFRTDSWPYSGRGGK